jgi:hypothetical protein
VGRGTHENSQFPSGLAQALEIATFQIAKTTVDDLEAVGGRLRGEIPSLHEGDLQPAQRGIKRDPRSKDASPDYEQVPDLVRQVFRVSIQAAHSECSPRPRASITFGRHAYRVARIAPLLGGLRRPRFLLEDLRQSGHAGYHRTYGHSSCRESVTGSGAVLFFGDVLQSCNNRSGRKGRRRFSV